VHLHIGWHTYTHVYMPISRVSELKGLSAYSQLIFHMVYYQLKIKSYLNLELHFNGNQLLIFE
jgi:hypothetical protein